MNRWILAARPATLTAAFVPVAVEGVGHDVVLERVDAVLGGPT